jgi:uncharacterized membrane protein YgcG
MRTFSILIASAMLVAALVSASMAEELLQCAGQYDSKEGTTFGRCAGAPMLEFQGAGSSDGAAAASAGGSGGSSGGSATAGNK